MSQVQFMHYRPVSGDSRGGATVAILPLEHEPKALITLARCGPNDVFNKKLGRDIAAGRLAAFLKGRVSATSKIREVDITDPLKLKKAVSDYLHDEMELQNLW